MKTIRQYFMAGLIMSAVYLIARTAIPGYDTGIDQYQTNLLKAQNYVLEKEVPAVVLVGSSETFRVPVSDVEEGYCNLGFAGESSRTGIELVLAGERFPETVMIEMNETLLTEPDEDILKCSLRKTGLLLNRVADRPDYIVYSAYRPMVDRLLSGRELSDTVLSAEAEKQLTDDASALDGLESLPQALESVKSAVSRMEEKGIHVILFEPPNEACLYDTPRYRYIREEMHAAFPDDAYQWFSVNWDGYNTNDGLHLGRRSAWKYAEAIVNYIGGNGRS